jgi:hypothetical protein
MKALSIYIEANDHMYSTFGESCWAENGPMYDAEAEDTLDSALTHIVGCCDAVLAYGETGDEPADIYDSLFLDANKDLDLIRAFGEFLSYKDPQHPWLVELQQLETFATLAEAA